MENNTATQVERPLGRPESMTEMSREGIAEQSHQLFAMTDEIAARACKIGGTTLRSVGDISRHQRLQDNEKQTLTRRDMMTEIYLDNREIARFLRLTHETCEKHNDIATASLIENWVDQADRRSWFLSEITKEV